jgi:hypothetical protein
VQDLPQALAGQAVRAVGRTARKGAIEIGAAASHFILPQALFIPLQTLFIPLQALSVLIQCDLLPPRLQ